MVTLLLTLLRANWQKALEAAFLLAVMGLIAYQNHELKNDKAKLTTAAMLHEADQGRIAYLSKSLQDQNDAVTAMQAAQAVKEQAMKKALAVAQTKQQRVVTLLAPTNDKRPSTCADAMPDVRTLLKGIQQ